MSLGAHVHVFISIGYSCISSTDLTCVNIFMLISNPKVFLKMIIPTDTSSEKHCSPYCFTALSTHASIFLILAVLMNVQQSHIVLLICILLINSEIEYPLFSHFDIYVVKSLFILPAHISISVFHVFLIDLQILFIFW